MGYLQILFFVFLYFDISCQNIDNSQTFIEISTLNSAGFSNEIWNRVDENILNKNFGLLNSVYIINKNTLILEKYYNNWDKNDLTDIQSSTKSITSLLIGMAFDQGYIKSVDQKMYEFFPHLNMEKQMREITLEHMLTMTTGIKWNEFSKKYRDRETSLGKMYMLREKGINYVFEQPVIDKPGTKFNYNSAISIHLGSILKTATNKNITYFAEKKLFEPLGIDNYYWGDYFGIAHCGGGLNLTSRDFAKMGYLCYNEGKWNGKQIVSKEWITESQKPRIKVENKTYYGYQWWCIDSLLSFNPIPYMAGAGWHYIFLCKEFETIIVITGKNYSFKNLNSTYTHSELLFGILACHPAFKEKILKMYELNKKNPFNNVLDILILAYSLSLHNEYTKAERLLTQYINDFSNDIRINYYLGEALYKKGDFKGAKMYLEKCIKIKELEMLPENGYFSLAKKILQDININGM